ncbi:alpha/beta hydrolase-fold protein [Stenotrophomonas sp. 24(2023)]|uniref:alpha/beta hydrolase n=1 Tax=Stenotrophomonas sp. 24(2023) TaxID=3068324 RepID=UPI0027DEFFC0|nr:alpha/beta hydrolase-fold protein [Stenotrophomonas sp. 24(2023)]WMJ69286.1 alpha/beta hydrolase-fold protein [Stenotrophomonas sp. 24(2023)]
MKSLICRTAASALLWLLSSPAGATTPPARPPSATPAAEVAVANSYKRSIVAAGNGVTYSLQVFMPRGYTPGDGKRYGVFYFIPGNAFGTFFSQVTRFLAAGDIPPLILVGVDFPPDDSYSMDLPTAGKDPHWTVPDNRGAANFLRIFQQDIKPYIDRSFPTNPDDTGIGGHSLGGFFALYALFNAPQQFQHVYASSPSLVWQDFVLLTQEQQLHALHPEVAARVFVDQGGLESDDGRLAALDAAVAGHHYPALHWHAERTQGQTHQTIAFRNAIDALYAIYGPQLRQAPAQELAGSYRTGDGRTFTLANADGQLMMIGFGDEPQERVTLLSSAPDAWFERYVWTRVQVLRDHGKVQGLAISLEDTPGPNGARKDHLVHAVRVPSAG